MKPKLSLGLSLLIALLLVAFGLVYGSVSGYADERAHVNALLEGDSGLLTVVSYRASDGLNLCVVADRHLTGDARVTELRAAAQALRQTGQTLPTLKQQNDTLNVAFLAVADALRANSRFLASTRDQQYLDMLSADFTQYGEHAIFKTYNTAVETFNQKLSTPVLGDLARFFGIKPCEAYA